MSLQTQFDGFERLTSQKLVGIQSLDLASIHKKLVMLCVKIEDIHAQSFPNYPIIEKIQEEEVLIIQETKEKEPASEGKGGEKTRKNQTRRKYKDVEEAKASSVQSAQDHQTVSMRWQWELVSLEWSM